MRNITPTAKCIIELSGYHVTYWGPMSVFSGQKLRDLNARKIVYSN